MFLFAPQRATSGALAGPLLAVALLCTSLAAGGCSHYGWAEPSAQRGDADFVAESGGDAIAVSAAVSTVAVEATRGVDASALTRTLVASLRERGVDARWGAASAGEQTIDCRVGLDEALGFGDHVRVEAIARCDVAGESFERIASMGAALDPASRGSSARPVHQATAATALRRVAAPLAESLGAAISSALLLPYGPAAAAPAPAPETP